MVTSLSESGIRVMQTFFDSWIFKVIVVGTIIAINVHVIYLTYNQHLTDNQKHITPEQREVIRDIIRVGYPFNKERQQELKQLITSNDQTLQTLEWIKKRLEDNNELLLELRFENRRSL